jgi:hypothetical protein
MNPNESMLQTFESNRMKNDLITEGLQDSILATPVRPPNLHLVKCCSRCRYARSEGLSVDCRKFVARGIACYAICDAYEEPKRDMG